MTGSEKAKKKYQQTKRLEKGEQSGHYSSLELWREDSVGIRRITNGVNKRKNQKQGSPSQRKNRGDQQLRNRLLQALKRLGPWGKKGLWNTQKGAAEKKTNVKKSGAKASPGNGVVGAVA